MMLVLFRSATSSFVQLNSTAASAKIRQKKVIIVLVSSLVYWWLTNQLIHPNWRLRSVTSIQPFCGQAGSILRREAQCSLTPYTTSSSLRWRWWISQDFSQPATRYNLSSESRVLSPGSLPSRTRQDYLTKEAS